LPIGSKGRYSTFEPADALRSAGAEAVGADGGTAVATIGGFPDGGWVAAPAFGVGVVVAWVQPEARNAIVSTAATQATGRFARMEFVSGRGVSPPDREWGGGCGA
jgi:hypothetical protein